MPGVGYSKPETDALLDGKQPAGDYATSGDLTALAASVAARLVAAYNLADLASPAAARTNLGLGSAATQLASSFAAASHAHGAGAITSGTLVVARGGTGADLSATGGTLHVVRQATVGGPLSTGPLVDADIPTLGASKIGTGTLDNARTTATAANTANAIVARGAAGEVAVGAVAAAGNVSVTAADPRCNVTATSAASTPGVVATNAGGEVGSLFVGGSASSYPGLVGFYTSGSAGFAVLSSGGTQLIRATQAGDVGVGTTSPAAKLDVAGDVALSGTSSTGAARQRAAVGAVALDNTDATRRYAATLSAADAGGLREGVRVVAESSAGHVVQALRTAPPADASLPNNTGVLYVDAGVLKARYRDGSGSLATLAPGTSAAGITSGTLAVARGGTGLGTIASGKLLYASATDTLAELTLGTNLSITGGTLNAAGGSGSPGGSTTQVQYNNAGAFGGAAGLLWNSSTSAFDVVTGDNGFTVRASGGFNYLTLRNGKVGVRTASTSADLTVAGSLSSTSYTLGSDLALVPIGSSSSSVRTYWGMELRGLSGVNFASTPTVVNARDAYHVVVATVDNSAAALGVAQHAASAGESLVFDRLSSTSAWRRQGSINALWADSTDATRKGRLVLSAYDAAAAREGLRVEASGSAPLLGFFGGSAAAKPSITGSRGGNAALASLLSALATLGLVTDSTTA